jgi:NitT/TauT family transport system substrate-binding protein
MPQIMNVAALAVAIGLLPGLAAAETIKIGMQKLEGQAPTFIAQEKGYFTAEGLTAEIVFFDSAQPVAVGTVSGDLDFGIAGIGGGFYSLAGQGALRIVGAYVREAPSFQATAYVVTNRAFDAGLKSIKDFPGHSIAVTQIGSSQHYALGLLSEKYGFDIKSLKILALQSGNNEASAAIGGQVDAALIPATYITAAIAQKQVQLVGWVGDETPWQLGIVFTGTKTANERGDMVKRFLAAYRKGVQDYHDAVTGPGEQRADQPTAPEIVSSIAKYVGESPEKAHAFLAYYDREGRLDIKDVLHQVEWFKAQGLVKGPVDGEALIDRRYVVPLPDR